MIWTPRESDLPPLVHSTMHLPLKVYPLKFLETKNL
jgi:hypothetical protein